MSGRGERFKNAGYTTDKPFIKVGGKSIIDHLAKNVFRGSDSTYFVCREDHLSNNHYYNELLSLTSKEFIIAIDAHKRGPVHTYLESFEKLPAMKDVIISYCDYFMSWDLEKYKQYIYLTSPDGNIPCYTGFHPHLLPLKNVYASCKVDEDLNLLEIKEKFSFELDKKKSLHSPGAYYFRNSETANYYLNKAIKEDLVLNGEYYISLVYNLLIKDNLKVNIFKEIPFFCQWGTPEDLQEFNYWISKCEDYQ